MEFISKERQNASTNGISRFSNFSQYRFSPSNFFPNHRLFFTQEEEKKKNTTISLKHSWQKILKVQLFSIKTKLRQSKKCDCIKNLFSPENFAMMINCFLISFHYCQQCLNMKNLAKCEFCHNHQS